MATATTLLAWWVLAAAPTDLQAPPSSAIAFPFPVRLAVAPQWPNAPAVRLISAVETLERLPPADLFDPAPPPGGILTPDPFAPAEEYVVVPQRRGLFANLWQDQVNFYSWQTLAPSLLAFGVGGTLANTAVDQNFRNWWQRDVSTPQLYNLALDIKPLGDGKYLVPAALALWLGGELLGDLPGAQTAARFGGRTTRGILVGFPMMLLMQEVTGGSRPNDPLPHPSHWKFFQDNNGVSGHAFMGAVPFLTAAQMVDDPFAKGVFLAGSTLVGLSRIETDDHYLSQVMLGWWMAYIATAAVQRTTLTDTNFSLEPMILADGVGIAFRFRR